MTTTFYILESVDDPKFPYRLTIRQDDQILLALRVQDKWPGQKGNILCIRESNHDLESSVKAIAELYALHPKLTIVFAGNRKLANEWAYRFFMAINAHENDTLHEIISNLIENYGISQEAKGGVYFKIKKKNTNDFPIEFILSTIKEIFPDTPLTTVRKAINDLKREGLIARFGEGKKSYWKKV